MELLDNKPKQIIPIVFAVDKNYIPYLAVSIQSIISNASNNNDYEIFVLHTDIGNYDQMSILSLAKNNIKIMFVNISRNIKKYQSLLTTTYHFTKAIYYRLVIPEIFANYSKIIYLDCDLVLNSDPAKLYMTDMGDNYIAAVQDISTLCKQLKWHIYSGDLNIKPHEYINSGVLLINMSKLNKLNFFDKVVDLLKNNKFLFPDQDVLNILCNGKILYLDYEFNFQWYVQNCTCLIESNFIGESTYINYVKAAENPYIIHFTSNFKPWIFVDFKYSEYFWKYARLTPYYEKLLFNLFRKNIVECLKPNWFKYYEYKFRSFLPGNNRNHYINKFNKMHARYMNLGLISKNKNSV